MRARDERDSRGDREPAKPARESSRSAADPGSGDSSGSSHDREAEARRESGQPGGGQGRRDAVEPTGVHPMSEGTKPGRDAEIRTQASWGQGERGAEGYEDSGGSELIWRDGQLLGGTTSGPSGEPTIDIHGGDTPADADETKDRDQ